MPAPWPRPAAGLMTNAVTIRILFALSPLTSINGVARYLSEKRNHQHSVEAAGLFRVAEIADADGHFLAALLGLILISAEEAIPPRKIEAEITIGLMVEDGMMHAVHVRRDDEPADNAIERDRHPHVAMVEHRRGVEQYLEHDHRERRRAQHHDHCELDEHGQDDLDRMKACASGDVKIEI